MYRSILVPLDGSQSSEHALSYAAVLARRSGAALQIAYVHTPLVMGEGAMYLATLEPQLCADEKKYVDGVVERLRRAGLDKVSGRVLEGPIAESLQEFALSEGSDLVVMTTHGRGPVSRFWLGSVADQLVHRLPMPLLLLRTRGEGPPPQEPTFRNILVALDGTPTAEQILEPVGELAKLMEASLTLLRVLLIPKAAGAFPSEQQWAEGHTYLDRVATSLREKGIAVNRCLLADAHPAAAILEEAESGGYDLLALSTRGRRGLPRLFLGSVADKVVRGASIPILVHRCLPA
jgi:nucleotide-binding universal stress UspA family protein